MYEINFCELNAYLDEVVATKGYDDISYYQPLSWDSLVVPDDEDENKNDNY